MANGSLTPTSYLVLGLLTWMGPMTPYDLKQRVAQGLGNFWSFPHTQLYTEPPRLAEMGLLTEKREHTGRRRRIFAITPDGRDAVQRWLGDPTPETTEIRDLALLKLYFGALASRDDVVALAAAQADSHQARLDTYAALDAQLSQSPVADGHSHATLRLGRAYERAAVAFWSSVRDDPPRSTPPRP